MRTHPQTTAGQPQRHDFYAVDLPPVTRGDNARKQHYVNAAAWMDANPGDWTPVNTFRYRTIVSAFRSGKYPAFPKGRYEFTSRKTSDDPPAWTIYGRLPQPAPDVEAGA